MNRFFYPRLAWDGLRKNRRLAWPYLLTCICMVAVFYIMGFLCSPATLALLPVGKSSAAIILTLGKWVILVFSVIFLYYTYSFLIRRRAREFGLYNVLGMGKRNLVRIISWENLITFAAALAGGLLAGILLSKLAELGLMNLLNGTVNYAIRVDVDSVVLTIVCFAAIFILITLSAVIRTARASAVNLMKSENVGEKPPKGSVVIALLGIILLGVAYWLAVSMANPVSALQWFFVAVILVILSTYLLMVTGSVRMCRILQGNKKYYYKAKHFVSVSSMAYRMKRNGAGLASICIIATMILVMLSTTTCMWFGAEDSLKTNYPREINLTTHLYRPEDLSDENLQPVEDAIRAYVEENGGTVSNIRDNRAAMLFGKPSEGTVQCDYRMQDSFTGLNEIVEIDLVPASRWAAEARSSEENILDGLADDEAVILTDSGASWTRDTITLAQGSVSKTFRVKAVRAAEYEAGSGESIVPRITMFVPDIAKAVEGFASELYSGDRHDVQVSWYYSFDTGLSDEENIRIGSEIEAIAVRPLRDTGKTAGIRSAWAESRAGGSADFYGMYGSLFFIGILLSAVFVVAAVLIIYYKQISEGYEDVKRFDIMQKVGMTKKDIRSSVRSQLLTVFALPLVFAGLHLFFAFPMIRKMLTLFSLYNVGLFIRTTVISFVVFAAFYAVVYRLTSGVYYRIVSNADTHDA